MTASIHHLRPRLRVVDPLTEAVRAYGGDTARLEDMGKLSTITKLRRALSDYEGVVLDRLAGRRDPFAEHEARRVMCEAWEKVNAS